MKAAISVFILTIYHESQEYVNDAVECNVLIVIIPQFLQMTMGIIEVSG